MSRRNTTSTAPFTQSGVASSSSSVYLNLVMILLAAIAIMYHDTDPFKERRASLLIFITATFCHAIALTTKTTCWLTTKLFHVSGATACEALLWLLVTELLWCILINVLMLLIMTLIFYKCVWELLTACFRWITVLGAWIIFNGEGSEAPEGNTFHSLFVLLLYSLKVPASAFWSNLFPLSYWYKSIAQTTPSKITGPLIPCCKELDKPELVLLYLIVHLSFTQHSLLAKSAMVVQSTYILNCHCFATNQ